MAEDARTTLTELQSRFRLLRSAALRFRSIGTQTDQTYDFIVYSSSDATDRFGIRTPSASSASNAQKHSALVDTQTLIPIVRGRHNLEGVQFASHKIPPFVYGSTIKHDLGLCASHFFEQGGCHRGAVCDLRHSPITAKDYLSFNKSFGDAIANRDVGKARLDKYGAQWDIAASAGKFGASTVKK